MLKLKSLIALKGYSQGAFASIIGMSPALLSLKINGKNQWKEKEIGIVCEVLDVCPGEVFFDGKFLKKKHTA